MTPSAFERNFSAFPTLVYHIRGLVCQNFVAFLVLLFLISGDDMEASLANTRIRLLRGFGWEGGVRGRKGVGRRRGGSKEDVVRGIRGSSEGV